MVFWLLCRLLNLDATIAVAVASSASKSKAQGIEPRKPRPNTINPGSLQGNHKARILHQATARFIMENGAKGVEVIISGKLRAQRAKAMKFRPSCCRAEGSGIEVFPEPPKPLN